MRATGSSMPNRCKVPQSCRSHKDQTSALAVFETGTLPNNSRSKFEPKSAHTHTHITGLLPFRLWVPDTRHFPFYQLHSFHLSSFSFLPPLILAPGLYRAPIPFILLLVGHPFLSFLFFLFSSITILSHTSSSKKSACLLKSLSVIFLLCRSPPKPNHLSICGGHSDRIYLFTGKKQICEHRNIHGELN